MPSSKLKESEQIEQFKIINEGFAPSHSAEELGQGAWLTHSSLHVHPPQTDFLCWSLPFEHIYSHDTFTSPGEELFLG